MSEIEFLQGRMREHLDLATTHSTKASYLQDLIETLSRIEGKTATKTTAIEVIREAFLIAIGPLRTKDIIRFARSGFSEQRIIQLCNKLAKKGEIVRRFDGWQPVKIVADAPPTPPSTFRRQDGGDSLPEMILRFMALGCVYQRADLIYRVRRQRPDVNVSSLNNAFDRLKRRGYVHSPIFGKYERLYRFEGEEEIDD